MRIVKKITKHLAIIFLYVILLFVIRMVMPCKDEPKTNTIKNNVSYTYKNTDIN